MTDLAPGPTQTHRGGRVLEPEIMDDPALDAREHAGALRGLARLNAASFAASPIASAMLGMLEGRRSCTLLDVAAGSGDVTLGVARSLRSRGIETRTILVDISERALEHASDRWRGTGFEPRCCTADVLRDDLPETDIAMCSLFFHHLTTEQAVIAAKAVATCARIGVVVNDLRRSAFGTMLARTIPRIMTRSRVVHTDAALSARAAFDEAEFTEIAHHAGMSGARVRRVFPARMMLTWTRPEIGDAR